MLPHLYTYGCHDAMHALAKNIPISSFPPQSSLTRHLAGQKKTRERDIQPLLCRLRRLLFNGSRGGFLSPKSRERKSQKFPKELLLRRVNYP